MALKTPDEELQGEQLLGALGYKQELKRAIGIFGNIALAVSDVSPTAGLLIQAALLVALAGTGSVWAYLIGCVLAINVALCMAELGSMFPIAGGLYSIVTRVLGRPIGFVSMVDYIGQAIFLPASVAVGVGTYISILNPGIPSKLAAGVTMAAVTLLALVGIKFNAWLTGVMLFLELSVVTVLAVSGAAHLQQPLSVVIHPIMSDGKGGILAVGLGAIFLAVPTAMFGVNGYDSAIDFSEETSGSAANVGKAVFTAALIGIVFELVTFVAVVFGVSDMRAFVNSSNPLLESARRSFGDVVYYVVTVGALIALFNASLAATLQFARIVWASGRDKAWPQPISAWIAKVHGGVPRVATLVVGGLGTALAFQTSLITIVTFTAVLIVANYALIALSALVSRVRQKHLPRPYVMLLWPIPPLIALVGVVIALTQQVGNDLKIVAVIFTVALVYYFVFLRPRADRYWNIAETRREVP